MFVVYAYTTIILFYKQTKENLYGRDNKSFGHDGNRPQQERWRMLGASEEERRLLYRSLSITGTYFLCWFPCKYFVSVASNMVISRFHSYFCRNSKQ